MRAEEGPAPNTRVQRTRSSPSALHAPLTRHPLGRAKARGRQEFMTLALLITALLGGQGAAPIPIPTISVDDRTRQDTTRERIIAITVAIESYAVEHPSYPTLDPSRVQEHCPDGAGQPSLPPRAWPPTKTAQWIKPFLEPDYIDYLPLVDGWDHPFRVVVTEDGCDYTIASLGKDGIQDARMQESWPREEINRDLVLTDGIFVSYFAGMPVPYPTPSQPLGKR